MLLVSNNDEKLALRLRLWFGTVQYRTVVLVVYKFSLSASSSPPHHANTFVVLGSGPSCVYITSDKIRYQVNGRRCNEERIEHPFNMLRRG